MRVQSGRLRRRAAVVGRWGAGPAAHERVRVTGLWLEGVAIGTGRAGRSAGPFGAGAALRSRLASDELNAEPIPGAVLPAWAIDKIRTDFVARPTHHPARELLTRLHRCEAGRGEGERNPAFIEVLPRLGVSLAQLP
ncbi:hypothetical protein [Streptomyces sulfonofaciens]|uniref:hypothetical protein n=1 Tax=Streptomyces sulfonofaciens TaxID=68272 RepID=UPI001673947A|nr:hypothetical protein [Streptomyces sulfonofaciens]